ncbi:segregation/condensation protein A [bacterium]|jgi:segregation and condensation protein A|nr:segregation/condensation protein A [bacterium]MBT4251173.1 segregation/condensation protein A [bacterium]MBT4598035.1 segregation/condensation protein A [bacterium]MBT6753553.1 segregation/condensation protein A [bacterium]MBT7037668.1 segregation/condensation protein A [bacterium]
MYQIKTKDFEGPLNLLLVLFEKQKLDVTKVSLVQVADDYLAFIEDGKSADLANLSEFFLIASSLLLIKSRALLPLFEFSVEEEEEIKDLEDRLKEYQKFKQAAEKIESVYKLRRVCFSRNPRIKLNINFISPEIDPENLGKLFVGVLSEIPTKKELAQQVMEEVVSLEEKMLHLKHSIEKRAKTAFEETVSGAKDKIEVIVTFLAMLEMIKQKTIIVSQKQLFGEIILQNMAEEMPKRQRMKS